MKSNKSFRCILSLLASAAIAHAEAPTDFQTFREIRRLQADAQMKILQNDHEDAAEVFLRVADLESSRAKKAAALVQAADQFMLAEESNRALETYKNLLQNQSLYAPHDHVVRQLRKLAENFVVGKGTFLSLCDVNGAIKIYELIIREAPAAHVSNSDRFRLAELLRQEDRAEEAVAIYQTIVKKNLRNWDARTELAIVLAQLAGISDGDGTKTRAAVREAKLVLAYKPDHPKTAQLKELIANAHELTAQRLLEQAEFYLGRSHRRPAAARRYLHDVILKYPDSKAATKARKLLKTDPVLVKLEHNPQATPEPQRELAQKAPQKTQIPKQNLTKTDAGKTETTHDNNTKTATAKTPDTDATTPRLKPAFPQAPDIRRDGKPAFTQKTPVKTDGKPAFVSHQRPRNDGKPAFSRPSPIKRDGKPAFDKPSNYTLRQKKAAGQQPKPAFDKPSPYFKLIHGLEDKPSPAKPAKPAFDKPSQFHLDQQRQQGLTPRKNAPRPALPTRPQAQKTTGPLFQPVSVITVPAAASEGASQSAYQPILPNQPQASKPASPVFAPLKPVLKSKTPAFQPAPIKTSNRTNTHK